jgi:hypothetical protein
MFNKSAGHVHTVCKTGMCSVTAQCLCAVTLSYCKDTARQNHPRQRNSEWRTLAHNKLYLFLLLRHALTLHTLHLSTFQIEQRASMPKQWELSVHAETGYHSQWTQ